MANERLSNRSKIRKELQEVITAIREEHNEMGDVRLKSGLDAAKANEFELHYTCDKSEPGTTPALSFVIKSKKLQKFLKKHDGVADYYLGSKGWNLFVRFPANI